VAEEASQSREGSETIRALLREVLDQTRELVRVEVALARTDVHDELGQMRRAGIAFGLGAGLGINVVSMLLVAVVTAFAREWLAALVVGAALALIAGASALIGRRWLPRRPLAETRDRIRTDLRQLKERVV
jgi:hypothetical protein